MKRLREWVLRFGGLFNKQRKDRELDDEIESHLQMHIEDNLRLGMTAEEARRQAMIKLGGIESTKEAYRDQRGLPLLETLWQDVRYGARMLRKNPGFTSAAVLALALGIGATTAIFSLINAALLRTLPFPDSDRLVVIWADNAGLRCSGNLPAVLGRRVDTGCRLSDTTKRSYGCIAKSKRRKTNAWISWDCSPAKAASSGSKINPL